MERPTNGEPLAKRLQIGKSLGTGAYATVYRAVLDGQPCALKVLLPQHSNNPRPHREDCPVSMFLREGHLLQRLDHRHVARCWEVLQLPPTFPGLAKGYTANTWALAMELMEGGSLARLLHKQMLAPWKWLYDNAAALEWSIDVAAALAYLHDSRPAVIHRDVKLDNVLLTTPLRGGKGGGGSKHGCNAPSAKLLDLGLHTCPLTLERCGRQTLLRARMSANGASLARSGSTAAAAPVTAAVFSNSGAKTRAPLPVDSTLSSSYFRDAGSPCPVADASAVPLHAVSAARGSLLTTHGSAACKPQLDSSSEPTSEDASTDGAVCEQEGTEVNAAGAGVIGGHQRSSMAKAGSLLLTTTPSLFFALPEEGLGAGTLVPVDINNPNLNQPLQPLSQSGDVQPPPATHGSSARHHSQQHSPCGRDQPQQQQQQQHVPHRALVRAQTQDRPVYGTRSTVRQHSLDGTRREVLSVSNCLYAVDGVDMERLSEGDHEGMEDVSRRGRGAMADAQQPSGEQGKCTCRGEKGEARAASSCSCHRRASNGAEAGGGGASWAHRIAGSGSRRAGLRGGSRDGSPLLPSSLVGWAAAKCSGAGSRHKLHAHAPSSPGCGETRSNATAAPSDPGAPGVAASAAVRVRGCMDSPAESPFGAASGIAAAANAVAADAAPEVDIGSTCGPAAAEAAATRGEHEGADRTPAQPCTSAHDLPTCMQGGQQPPSAASRAPSRHSSSLAPRRPAHTHSLFSDPTSQHRSSTTPIPVPAAFPAGERTRALSGPVPALLTHLSASGTLQHARVLTDKLEPTPGITVDTYPPAPATAPAAPRPYTATADSPTAARPHTSGALGVAPSSCGKGPPDSPDTPLRLATAAAAQPPSVPRGSGAAVGCGSTLQQERTAPVVPPQPTPLPTRTAVQQQLLPHQHSHQQQLPPQCSAQHQHTHQHTHQQHQLLDVADLEVVYRLTGETGSAMAMAPEICLKQPYNEKIDVYAFGILMFELWSRSMLVVSHIGTRRPDLPRTLHKCEDFADLVAGGYRPAQPASVPNAVWALITDCWHQDPLCRPSMSAVEQRLRELRGSNYEAVQPPQQQDRSARSGTAPSRALTGGGASAGTGTGTGTLSRKDSRQSVGLPGGVGEGGAEGGGGGAKAGLGCGCVIC